MHLARFWLTLGMLLVTIPSSTTWASPVAQTCTFTFGFKSLYDAIPEIVGDCVTNATAQANGDVQQPTTRGLLAWRKADNWTAFTDGATTWINGPCGLQSRPNTDLLPFERGEADPCGGWPPSPYSGAAVWDWYDPAIRDALPGACGVEYLFELSPDDPRDMGCVLTRMRSLGAGEEAVRFFEATTMFLSSFGELGRVDLGVASAPWFNMGRSEFVFLNGTPSVISISAAVPRDWESAPEYAGVLRGEPYAFPWAEYADFLGSEILAGGGQRITVAFPLQPCRACDVVARMPVGVVFEADGHLVMTELLPPVQP
jgi:hypothetical protein